MSLAHMHPFFDTQCLTGGTYGDARSKTGCGALSGPEGPPLSLRPAGRCAASPPPTRITILREVAQSVPRADSIADAAVLSTRVEQVYGQVASPILRRPKKVLAEATQAAHHARRDENEAVPAARSQAQPQVQAGRQPQRHLRAVSTGSQSLRALGKKTLLCMHPRASRRRARS